MLRRISCRLAVCSSGESKPCAQSKLSSCSRSALVRRCMSRRVPRAPRCHAAVVLWICRAQPREGHDEDGAPIGEEGMPLPRLLRSLHTPPAALLRSQCVLCEGGEGGEGGGEPLKGEAISVSKWGTSLRFRKGCPRRW